jgi:peptide/nickel transport system substrate-binding protein
VTANTPPSPTPVPATPTTLPTPIDGGTAILGVVGRATSLNPITDNTPALRELTPLLFDTLLRVDPYTAALQPGLAERWEYTEDGEQVIFHLPAGLTWSDGTPLTAADIAESLDATQHPALLAFSDIGARNDETLVFTFLNIDCAAVTTLAQLPLLPAQEITATIPTGSGPFMVSEWSRTLNLIRNPNYHGQPPNLDGFTIRFLHEDEIEIAVSEGQFDVIGPIELSIVNDKLTVNNSAGRNTSAFAIHNYPAPQVHYIAINYDPHNDDPLAPEVREALLLALDRETILAGVLDGDGQLMANSLLPGHWAANDTLSLPDYDTDTARDLLTDAGLRDTDGDGWLDRRGERLELGIRLNGRNPLHQNLGWLVSSYYRDLGLFARAESVPIDSVVDDLFTHDFTLALFSWSLLPDPDQRLFWQSTENEEGLGLNFTSYNNPQIDELLDQGVAIPGCRPQERANIYNEVQEILSQDRPVDFLLAPNRHLLVDNRLHGLQPGPFVGFTWNAPAWFLEGE